MKYVCFLVCFAMLAVGCGSRTEKMSEEGVSLELARFRAANYRDVRYDLRFSVPEDRAAAVGGVADITFTVDRKTDAIIDFTGGPEDITTVTINGEDAVYSLRNEHIIIERKNVRKGENTVSVEFTAGDRSLNRRDGFLYTLLVPDRARTLFPCFDQPDLKAVFALTLEVPKAWKTVGNGSEAATEDLQNERKSVSFRPTEPIPTYLFSFVAGVFDKVTEERGGRSISLYHRETDPVKIAQCGSIFDEVFHSLAWLEDYTGIAYPFEKYDLIILPGFQYGGMEHMGATLYNDNRMFMERNATITDSLNRSSLIAHETAHMWFGDYVTMKWFNDVWNKEVFANWFAAKIVEPMYPNVNHRLNFIISNYPAAYSEDRTGGAMPIQQPLDNLRDAGLIYSNIVYCKSPIVMDMLVRKVGDAKFRDAIREYLRTYSYGNADWDDLIAILDARTDEDLRAWSDAWIKEKGMPTVSLEPRGDSLFLTQSDPWGRGVVWDQSVQIFKIPNPNMHDKYSKIFAILKPNIHDKYFKMMDFRDGHNVIPTPEYYIMNVGCLAYGYFQHDKVFRQSIMQYMHYGSELGFSFVMNCYEELMNRTMKLSFFLQNVMEFLWWEQDMQLFTQALAYAESFANLFLRGDTAATAIFEKHLLAIADGGSETSIPAIRAFCRSASTPEGIAKLYEIWSDGSAAANYSLGERDLISASYLLAIRMPEKAEEIVATQLSRITNPDRRREYEFVSRAVDPSQEKRDAFFEALLTAENRAVEPWAVSALRLLNHPARERESLKYIRPALDVLHEVQRTGDIFLPSNWCSALLGGHASPEALDTVREFFAQNPGYHPLLASKIKIKADHLYIVNDRLNERYE